MRWTQPNNAKEKQNRIAYGGVAARGIAVIILFAAVDASVGQLMSASIPRAPRQPPGAVRSTFMHTMDLIRGQWQGISAISNKSDPVLPRHHIWIPRTPFVAVVVF